MKHLIERYVYDVTRRLPEAQRADVEKELNANINDMLGENPSEKEIEDVLNNLGHPRQLANNYRGQQYHLIGPEWMDDYVMVLKIVLVVLGVIALVSGVFGGIMSPEATTVAGIIAEVFAKTISGIITAMLNGFAIVTIIFFLIERSNKKREDNFDIRRLPELPKKTSNEIKRGPTITGLIFETIFGVLFIYLLATGRFNVIWFDQNMNIDVQNALFTQTVVNNYVPIFIVCLAVSIFADIYKLLRLRWDMQMFAVHAFSRILSAVVAVAFLTSSNLLNPDLFQQFADLSGTSSETLINAVMIAFKVISAFVIIGTVADLLTIYFKKMRIH